MRKKNKIRHVGTVMLKDSGRPMDVYCNGWRPSALILRHEVLLTDFCLLYDAEYKRGPSVDQDVRPDAEMVLNGMKFFIELDTGEMGYRDVARRWKRYREINKAGQDFVLVVSIGERRRDGMMKHAKGIENVGLFACLKHAIEDPFGSVWMEASGNEVGMPQYVS